MGQGQEVIHLGNGCQFLFNHNLCNFFLNITELPMCMYIDTGLKPNFEKQYY